MADAATLVNEKSGNPIADLQARFAKLPQKNKVALLFGVPLLIGALISLFLWANAASYRVLFTGLTDKDGGEIVAALDQLQVPYQFGGNGSTILVPSDKVYDTRLALASKGLPKASVTGFEAMDNQRLGVTQFQEQVNYQRALEGELVRSIQALSAVQNARVHLAIPKPSIFIRERQQPSASVILTLYGGRTLSEAQVAGIVHLVSSSLPGMEADNVSIVDQSGRLLTQQSAADSAGIKATQLTYTTQIEQNLTGRIIDILTPVFGRDNVRATVTADMDFAQTERTDEFYKPNGDTTQATIRSQQVNESREGDAGTAQGVPGVLSNTPPGQANAPVVDNPQANLQNNGNATGQSNSLRRDSTINYEVDKTVKYTKDQVGKIQRLSAAVVVNFKTITDPKGGTRQVPLTPEEITQVNELVKQAIGYNEPRGDQLNVANQQFAVEEVPEMAIWQQPETMDLVKSLGLPLGVALVAAILVFGLFKPMLKPMESDNGEGPSLLPNGMGNTPLLAGPESSDLEVLEQFQRDGSLPGNSKQEKLERLRRLAKEHPQIVANIVKNWVNGEAKSV